MANTNGESGAAKRPLFNTSFRGYTREEVDAFLNQVAKEVAQLQEDLRQVRSERDDLAATAAAMEESVTKAEARASEVDRMRAERENLLAEIGILGERAAKAENDAREKAERIRQLDQEKHSADPILRAAQETSDRMLTEARANAERIQSDAESRAAITLEEMRRRLDALRSEYEAAQVDYEKFLDVARRHVSEFQRKLEERASDRYLS
jgi:DivIVA domain-containing protein